MLCKNFWVKKILEERITTQTISNNLIRQYCRGTNVFYDAFYRCRRSSKTEEEDLVSNIEDYVEESDRAVVELLVKNKLHQYKKYENKC